MLIWDSYEYIQQQALALNCNHVHILKAYTRPSSHASAAIGAKWSREWLLLIYMYTIYASQKPEYVFVRSLVVSKIWFARIRPCFLQFAHSSSRWFATPTIH